MKATVEDVMSAEVVAVTRGVSFKEMAAKLRQAERSVAGLYI